MEHKRGKTLGKEQKKSSYYLILSIHQGYTCETQRSIEKPFIIKIWKISLNVKFNHMVYTLVYIRG